MPIDHKETSTLLYQRDQYQKGGIGRWYWDWRDKKIFDYIEKSHRNILDIGCGEGVTLGKLIARYPERNILGIDIMTENVAICQRFNLPVLQGSIYNLELADDSLDICIMSEVIEHLDNVELALVSLRRVLRPGGDLIIVFPNDQVFKIARIMFLKFKEAYADPGHLRQFTPRIIRKVLPQSGFKIIKVKNTPFYFWPISLHCVVLAKKI